jgi:diamine N-acetyltransferase
MLANECASGQALVRLVPVGKDNFHECINLPMGEDHKHLGSIADSIAQTQEWPGSQACCIYHGDEMVGYTLFGPQEEDRRLYIWVNYLMVAEGQRGKGYGRAALQQIIAEARQKNCVEVALRTPPDNYKAIRLYEDLGFHASEMEGNGVVYICPIQAAGPFS